MMQFAVEAWEPEYGTGGDIDALDASTDVVDRTAEFPVDDWRPLDPDGAVEVDTAYFVDGVRRIDARIWVTEGPSVLAGSCATVAAGAVACDEHSAVVVATEVRRAVLTPPVSDAASIATDYGTYEHFEVRTGSPEDLYLGIHEVMTDLETRTVPDAGPDDVIIFDGPLRGRAEERGVGFVKTQHVQYLEDRLQAVVADLEAGQRTPLFVIGSPSFARWSWYLRLPGPRTHGWAGIVRCEASGRSGVDAAVQLADTITAILPRFASEPHKESRAPQNLYPIKGLERELRRRLGDQRLLHRSLSKIGTPAHNIRR